MSAIDSENISKPSPAAAKPKGGSKPAKKAKPAERQPSQEVRRQTEGRQHK